MKKRVLAGIVLLTSGLKNCVTITLFSNSAFATGVNYNDPAKAKEANGDIMPENTIFYYDSTANGYLTLGEFVDANGNNLLPGVVANAQLVITDMTSGYVKGTFSGTVYKSSTFTRF